MLEFEDLRLRNLPFGARVALSLLLLVTAGGYVASGLHLVEHHQGRDDRQGLTITDVEGVYHGTTRPALLASLLEDGHPSEVEGAEPLDATDREVLLEWARGDRIAENWSNIDFGDGYGSPEEVVGTACAVCHGTNVALEQRAAPELSTWDDYAELAFPREIHPTDEKILLASTHAHAIAMATITFLIVLLAYATRLPGFLKGLLCFAASAGLAVDLAAWWLAREDAAWVTAIWVGGATHAGGMGLLFVLIFLDLWFPKGRDAYA